MSSISLNIKYLRKKHGFTQEQLAEKVGIKRSLVGAYEEGRAEPNISNLLKFSKVLDASVDSLINSNLSDGPTDQKIDTRGQNLRVVSISLDSSQNENIHLVPQKASAGYLNGYSDPEYIAELPVFNIPVFKHGTYRAFEISGDSMLPLNSGSIIIGKYLENWEQIKDNTPCVLVTASEGLVFKRVFNQIKADASLRLVSDNPEYKPYLVMADDIKEIWEAKGYFSTSFPEPDSSVNDVLDNIKLLQDQLTKFKKSGIRRNP